HRDPLSLHAALPIPLHVDRRGPSRAPRRRAVPLADQGPRGAPMITVPASFREMPRWWHDEAGRAWLDRLPALVAGHSALWNLTSDRKSTRLNSSHVS